MGFSSQEHWKYSQALHQGIFPTQGSNPGLFCLPTQANGFSTTGAPGLFQWIHKADLETLELGTVGVTLLLQAVFVCMCVCVTNPEQLARS